MSKGNRYALWIREDGTWKKVDDREEDSRRQAVKWFLRGNYSPAPHGHWAVRELGGAPPS